MFTFLIAVCLQLFSYLFTFWSAICLHFGQLFVYFSRLRCIVWDLSRSFLLRLAISIFTVILIYTMAQVNTFTCSVDSCEAALEECEARGTCHRICPLPQYIVLSCMLGFLAVAVFLRMPIMIKRYFCYRGLVTFKSKVPRLFSAFCYAPWPWFMSF